MSQTHGLSAVLPSSVMKNACPLCSDSLVSGGSQGQVVGWDPILACTWW